MEEEEEIKCGACGSTSTATKSWYGRAPNHYCHKRGCIRAGVEAGHITPRSNQQGSRSAGDGREFTEEMEQYTQSRPKELQIDLDCNREQRTTLNIAGESPLPYKPANAFGHPHVIQKKDINVIYR